MKKIIFALILVSVGIATAYAGNFQLLHVGSTGGSGVAPTCNGTIDLSTGCVQPMLGGL
jgi:hypothetical protein